MGSYTEHTRTWLDRRFRQSTDGIYFAHQPIWGLGEEPSDRGHPKNLARTFQILREIARIDGDSVLDVGGGEGVVAHLAQVFLGVPGMSCDLSLEACRRAYDFFGVDSAAVSSHRLPFADQSFEIVVCSEVLEHVEFPADTLAELDRVARRAVIVTTMEVEHDRAAIDHHVARRCGFPHGERNLFHPEDLLALHGPHANVRPQFAHGPFQRVVVAEEVVQWILEDVLSDAFLPDSMGAIVVGLRDASARRAVPRLADRELATRLVDFAVPKSQLMDHVRPDPRAGLAARIVCPRCHGSLVAGTAGDLRCAPCAESYPVCGGTPDLTVSQDPDPARTEAELRRRWSTEPRRLEAFQAIRDQLAEPDISNRWSWDFTLPACRRGWLPNDELVPRGAGFAFDSRGVDPWIISPGLYRDTVAIAAIRITMRIHNPDYRPDEGLGQLYWLGAVDSAFSVERSVTFSLINDGEPHVYEIDLATHEEWRRAGVVICLRLDPANGPCAVELLAVELVRSLTP